MTCEKYDQPQSTLNRVEPGDELASLLFMCIVLSLLPVVVASFVQGFYRSGLYPLVVGGSFGIQVMTLLFYFLGTCRRGMPKLILVAWAFSTPYLLTLIVATFSHARFNAFDLINALVRFASVTVFFVFPYYGRLSDTGMRKFMSALVLLGLVACVYNMIVNFQGLMSITSIRNPYEVHFSSFFLNRNNFGQFLLFAIMANTFLLVTNRTTRYILANYGILLINLFATLSRTAILSVFIFLLMFSFIRSKKKSLLVICAILVVLLGLVFFEVSQHNSGFIRNMMLRPQAGTTGRTRLWQEGLRILDQTSWILGTGYLTGRDLLVSGTQFHNFFIEALVGGGTTELLIFLVFFGLFFGSVRRRICKFNKVVGAFYTAAYISVFAYALFESASFFSMGFVDSIFTIFLITVPALYANNAKKQTLS